MQSDRQGLGNAPLSPAVGLSPDARCSYGHATCLLPRVPGLTVCTLHAVPQPTGPHVRCGYVDSHRKRCQSDAGPGGRYCGKHSTMLSVGVASTKPKGAQRVLAEHRSKKMRLMNVLQRCGVDPCVPDALKAAAAAAAAAASSSSSAAASSSSAAAASSSPAPAVGQSAAAVGAAAVAAIKPAAAKPAAGKSAATTGKKTGKRGAWVKDALDSDDEMWACVGGDSSDEESRPKNRRRTVTDEEMARFKLGSALRYEKEDDPFSITFIFSEREFHQRRKQRAEELQALYKAQEGRLRSLLETKRRKFERSESRREDAKRKLARLFRNPQARRDHEARYRTARFALTHGEADEAGETSEANKATEAAAAPCTVLRGTDDGEPGAAQLVAGKNDAVCKGRGGDGRRCRVKCMPMSEYCHVHIYHDPNQRLFKKCEHVVPKGQIFCTAPVLVTGRFCPQHAGSDTLDEGTPRARLAIMKKKKKKSSKKRQPDNRSRRSRAGGALPDPAAMYAKLNQLVPKVQQLRRRLRDEEAGIVYPHGHGAALLSAASTPTATATPTAAATPATLAAPTPPSAATTASTPPSALASTSTRTPTA